jgi:sulfur carrier protein
VSPTTEREVHLTVNGESRGVPVQCTLQGLLQLLDLEGRRVAVAVNRDVVPRSAFASRRLATGDRIEILEAVGGG